MRAIAAGNLPARRDNRNQWQIEVEALEHWHADRTEHDRSMSMDHDRTTDRTAKDHLSALVKELAEARRQTAEERARAGQLETRLEERTTLVSAADARAQMAEADRDRWRALAEKLTDQLGAREPQASASAPNAPKPRRWWFWRSDRQ